MQLAESVFKEVKLTRQPLKDVPGVHMPADAVGIALIPQPRKAGEAISAFESEAVQQSTVELLTVVRPAATHCFPSAHSMHINTALSCFCAARVPAL